MDFLAWLRHEARLKNMVLVIVFMALFLDHMLLSLVVPILPSYLYDNYQAAAATAGNSTDWAAHPRPAQPVSHTSEKFSTFASPNNASASSSDSNMAKKSPTSNCSRADSQLDKVNIKVGLLLASKSAVQLLCNPLVGPLVDRIGCHIPMCAGFCITILATTLFAFSSSYYLLLLARSVQGAGGSCLSVAGLTMLADMFKDDKERGQAMGISFSGLALGLILGAPFGSVMYEFVGKTAPFLFLAVIAVLAGGLHVLIFRPSQVPAKMEKGTPMMTLMKDPYILIAAGSICFTTMIIATLETALPIWMLKTMCSSDWQLGIVFLPDSISYLIASSYCGPLSQKHNASWLYACIGMILAGIATISFGFTRNILQIIVLNTFVGFAVGTVDSSVMPLMGYLVDLRYMPVYGTVYAIADIAICIGFCVGPAIAGPIATSIGFTWLMVIIGSVNIVFAPLSIFLFSPAAKKEHLPLTKGHKELMSTPD